MSASMQALDFMMFTCSMRRLVGFIVVSSWWRALGIPCLLSDVAYCSPHTWPLCQEDSLSDHALHHSVDISGSPCRPTRGGQLPSSSCGISSSRTYRPSHSRYIVSCPQTSPLLIIHSAASAVSNHMPREACVPNGLSVFLSHTTSSM